MKFAGFLTVASLSYLLGSIPTGFLVARASGVDIRNVGSGNIGATNVFRILGKPAGVFVLLVDALKGYLACRFVAGAGAHWIGSTPEIQAREVLSIVAGLSAILGHNYTVWLRFRGGKGIATSAGVMAALWPLAFLITLGTWILVLAISRYVSLASIAGAVALPVATWATGQSKMMIFVSTAMSVLAIYKHKRNIERLLNGTEHRFGSPR